MVCSYTFWNSRIVSGSTLICTKRMNMAESSTRGRPATGETAPLPHRYQQFKVTYDREWEESIGSRPEISSGTPHPEEKPPVQIPLLPLVPPGFRQLRPDQLEGIAPSLLFVVGGP